MSSSCPRAVAQTQTEAAGKTTTKAWVGPSADAVYCHSQKLGGKKKQQKKPNQNQQQQHTNHSKNPACQASIKVFFLIDNQAETWSGWRLGLNRPRSACGAETASFDMVISKLKQSAGMWPLLSTRSLVLQGIRLAFLTRWIVRAGNGARFGHAETTVPVELPSVLLTC